MNGIARVMVSVVLLGACALAMRFTMQAVNTPMITNGEFKRKLDVSKAKTVEMQLELGDAEFLVVQSGESKHISATYKGFNSSGISLSDDTSYLMPQEQDLTRVTYFAGMNSTQSFFGAQPRSYGTGELFLPQDIPLDINFFQTTKYTNAPKKTTPSVNIDLTSLWIKNFKIYSDNAEFQSLSVRLPTRTFPKSMFLLQNRKGFTNIRFTGSLQGRVVLASNTGLIYCSLSDLGKNPNVNLMIWGDASDAESFRKRIETSKETDLNFVLQNPKKNLTQDSAIQWYVTGQSKNNNRNALSIEIQLGKSGRVKFQ